tara:strand:+ start:205 stop:462 length:258 start_codon:yes stop_codon:yes gene_type:complete
MIISGMFEDRSAYRSALPTEIGNVYLIATISAMPIMAWERPECMEEFEEARHIGISSRVAIKLIAKVAIATTRKNVMYDLFQKCC